MLINGTFYEAKDFEMVKTNVNNYVKTNIFKKNKYI